MESLSDLDNLEYDFIYLSMCAHACMCSCGANFYLYSLHDTKFRSFKYVVMYLIICFYMKKYCGFLVKGFVVADFCMSFCRANV